ncbi:fructosamine kinase family protein [Flagellimonas allohymeniacidonis]|uniref:Fructosamine kinase n=1 Tax=Flagellimonas allohymeniacidonis TaxID=2517819 RepID=A0A4Q8QE27_9FLAO|nr:fructosamine kinase family protein [Allomuricauda hymeniacidonis]TAI48671.1 fructosamine kinase [Allomuricauda hymeniacidonis]
MFAELKPHLERILDTPILEYSPVHGGDISKAYEVFTPKSKFFVKTSTEPWAEDLFIAEAKGLEQLGATKTIKVPKVYHYGRINGNGYLVLEFVDRKNPNTEDFRLLGRKLAELHLTSTSSTFGAKENNFIGHLPQNNIMSENWAEFYVGMRIESQLEIAVNKGLLSEESVPPKEKTLKICNSIIGPVKSSLLHGDLWSGNFLIAKDGTPHLIDPSVYHGHSEVDIAMSRLFGGFDSSFYKAYYDIMPKHDNPHEITEIYQLYYLLVHLNLFGNTYRNAVLSILDRYFR